MNYVMDADNHREIRERKVAAMGVLIARAESEHRNLSTAEAAEFDQLDREARQLERAAKSVASFNAGGGQVVKRDRTAADDQFTRYLRTGEVRATGTGLSTSPNNGQSGSDNAGYGIPEGFWAEMAVALKAYGGLSNDFRQLTTDTGNPMPWPTIDPTGVEASLVTDQLTQLDLTNPYVFGQGEMSAWTIAVGPVPVALQLVEDWAFDVDEFVAARFGEALGRKIAAYAITGSGSGQPLGIRTALAATSDMSSGGVLTLGTATEVNTINGTTVTELVGNVLSAQTLINMIESVDPAYRNDPTGAPTAKFYVSDGQLAGLRTVADTLGRPILQQPNDGGAPMLWGYPVVVDNGIPALSASTVGGPLFGNMQHAMVMRTVRDGARVLRLTERYADFLAVGYLGYYRMDIRSNDLRSAVTIECAAT